MSKKISIVIGVIILFCIGFVGSSIVAASKSVHTFVVFAQYPLTTDQWFLNDQVVSAGRVACLKRKGTKDSHIRLERLDGNKAEITIKTVMSLDAGFPYVAFTFADPLPGFNVGMHIEELTSSTPYQNELTCR